MVQTNESIAERTRGDADETIYVVAGEGTLRIGGREHALSASSFVTVPRGTAHSITRRGSRPLDVRLHAERPALPAGTIVGFRLGL